YSAFHVARTPAKLPNAAYRYRARTGGLMTSTQYEELCRLFLSELLHIPIEQIWTLEMPSPWRPGLIPYRHQIDLFWKFEDAVGQYLSIANANGAALRKWTSRRFCCCSRSS